MKTISGRSIKLILLIIAAAGPLLATTLELSRETEPRTLGRVFTRLRSGRPVTVAFLGGSATSGRSASQPEKSSFRALVGQWLRTQYVGTRIESVDASVPGTGAVYATLRLRRDLLSYKPDLVIFECSREDQTADQKVTGKAVEGILRQLLVQAEPPEILMLLPPEPEGKPASAIYQTLADHYAIATLDLHRSLSNDNPTELPWNRAGELTDRGHRLIASQIILQLQFQARLPVTPIARRLPQPLFSDELNYGELKVLAEYANGKGWKKRPNRNPQLPTALATSDQPGSTIETIFEGTVVGLTWLRGPKAGIFEVLIDGKPAPAPLTRIDGYAEKEAIGTAIIAGGLGLGEHRLTIRLLPDRPDRRRSTEVRLGYLLVGGQRPERL